MPPPPLTVAWVPQLSGRLGITRAPGSEDGAVLSEELASLRQQGVDHIVCFLEDEEFAWLWEDHTAVTYAAAVASAGMALSRFPVEDYTAPSPAQCSAIVAAIQAAMAAGEAVLVHCMAGRGRAGTAAAAVLIAAGMKPAEAILLVRWVRPGAIQSADQEAMLLGLTG